jgi:S-adenosylmethionine/arginine decarboxylase-like enzyme
MNGNKEIYLASFDTKELLTVLNLADFTYDLAHFLNFTPNEYDYHLYPGNGITFTRFLSESHITVDTYPEAFLLELSVSSCKDINTVGIEEFCKKFGLTMRGNTHLRKIYTDEWKAI